jgi:hypothetical protein
MARPPLLGLLATLALALALAPSAHAQGGDASFTLVNRGPVPLREVFVTPAGDANWGRNRLDRAALPPGGRFEVRRRRDGNCIMDIRAVFADGRTEDRRGLNTCAVDAVAVGEPVASVAKGSDDPSFRLVNRGSQPIAELFATPAGMTNWGQNRLVEGALPPATEKLVRIARTGNCLFDLKVVFADGKALEKHHADLCRITDLPVP